MAPLLSVALTEDQVLDRTKDVTRRLGWWTDRNGRRLIHSGDELQLCRKVMGRRPGEPLIRLALVDVSDVRREPLNVADDEEAAREGFGNLTGPEFVAWYAETFRIPSWQLVTRIEWTYRDEAP